MLPMLESIVVATAVFGLSTAWFIVGCAKGRDAPRKGGAPPAVKSKSSVKSKRAAGSRSARSARSAKSKSSKSSKRPGSKRSSRSARSAARSARKSARDNARGAKASGRDAAESAKSAVSKGAEAVKRKADEGYYRAEPKIQKAADKAESAKEQVKEKAISAKDTAKDKAQSAKEQVKEKAISAKDTVKDKAQSAKEIVKEKAIAAKDAVKDAAQSAKESIQGAAPTQSKSLVKTQDETSVKLQDTQLSRKERPIAPAVDYNSIPAKELHMEPQQLRFTKDGGLLNVVLHNSSAERQAVKIKCSDNKLYRVNPVYAFIEGGSTLRVDVSRQNGSAKADKLVFVQAKASAEDTNPQAAFKGKNAIAHNQRLVVLPLLA